MSEEFVPDGPFCAKAPILMRNLMADLGISKEAAAGIVGNLAHESAGLKADAHECGQPAQKGGIGWAQWTGIRRRAFEKFCRDNAMVWSEEGANYAFLLYELRTTEKKALQAIMIKRLGVEEYCRVFCRVFERPGVIAMDSRLRWAGRAYDSI